MEWMDKQEKFINDLMVKYNFPIFVTEAGGKVFDKLMVGNNCLYLCFQDNTCWYIQTGHLNNLCLDEEPSLTYYTDDIELFSEEAYAELKKYDEDQMADSKEKLEYDFYLTLKEKFKDK